LNPENSKQHEVFKNLAKNLEIQLWVEKNIPSLKISLFNALILNPTMKYA